MKIRGKPIFGFLIVAVILLVGLAACGTSEASGDAENAVSTVEPTTETQAEDPTPDLEATIAAAVQAALAEQATATPIPTAQLFPTATTQPTSTPVPTSTPMPTATLLPTATIIPTATLSPTVTPFPTPTQVPAPTATTQPTPTLAPTPAPTPVPSYYLWINDTRLGAGQSVVLMEGSTIIVVSPTANAQGTFEKGTVVTMEVQQLGPYQRIDWRGVTRVVDETARVATVRINDETWVTVFFPSQY